ncbi:glycosyltransferase family 4 protein [Cryobacterium sp. TMT2-10]|uniref:glycosyltransferase n=1 Tax=Cryobacterium sp. TMT2-10 TaxID=1259244 RepID=UPI0010691B4D|nr:glycosyltransferase [Cryobacterium sp. TMT2-10]TFD37816.1 glycosyltransferase family 4 protein [Cryobacterium sp. TMT2-10]
METPEESESAMRATMRVDTDRILVVCGYWPTRQNEISGIFMVQQVAAILSLGLQVTVLVPMVAGKNAQSFLSPDDLGLAKGRVNIVHVPMIRVPSRFASWPGFLKVNTVLAGVGFAITLHRLRESVNVSGCIVHDGRYAGVSLPFWRRYFGGKVVLVLHGVDPYFASSRRRAGARSLFRKLGDSVDVVALVGGPLLKHALSLGLPRGKICVVSNGTDLPIRAYVSDAQRPASSRRQVVSVANLTEIKGIDVTLRALKSVASRRPELDWGYRIVGDGAQRESLEALSESLGLSSNVEFVGRISYAQTMREISQCDIFCLASWGEAFGIVYLEAMARMRPVIGCLENGPEDFVTSGRDGVLVAPQNDMELADALEALLGNPMLCGQIGRAGRQTAERFTWEANATKVLDLLGVTPP